MCRLNIDNFGGQAPPLPILPNPAEMTRLTNAQAATINSMTNLAMPAPQGIGSIGEIPPNPWANQYADRVFKWSPFYKKR